MEGIRTYLESSTVHGLGYISSTKRLVRLFWIVIVIGGFTGAGVMIYQSFDNWAESPVKIDIETLPVRDMTFPKVTVCPPVDTYTNLNYDLVKTENTTLVNDTRDQLNNFALELLYDDLHDIIMTNLSLLEDDDRYYNWYHGFTKIVFPYSICPILLNIPGYPAYTCQGVLYEVTTTAPFGTITTQHFGENFEAEKVESLFIYQIHINPPKLHDANSILHLEINREPIIKEDVTSGSFNFKDDFVFSGDTAQSTTKTDTRRYIFKNYTKPSTQIIIRLDRQINKEDISRQKLQKMPGFRVSWYYTGIDIKTDDWIDDKIKNDQNTKLFVRNRLFH